MSTEPPGAERHLAPAPGSRDHVCNITLCGLVTVLCNHIGEIIEKVVGFFWQLVGCTFLSEPIETFGVIPFSA